MKIRYENGGFKFITETGDSKEMSLAAVSLWETCGQMTGSDPLKRCVANAPETASLVRKFANLYTIPIKVIGAYRICELYIIGGSDDRELIYTKKYDQYPLSEAGNFIETIAKDKVDPADPLFVVIKTYQKRILTNTISYRFPNPKR